MWYFIIISLIACGRPRNLDHGRYNQDVENYAEGQSATFYCNDYARREPSNGVIVCGSDGWYNGDWYGCRI